MATRGRPPKPIEVKRRQGNPGKRALPKEGELVALEPAQGIPPAPISLGEAGVAMWRSIWSGPASAWLAPAVDSLRVQTVCNLVDDIAEYRRLISRMGPVLIESALAPNGFAGEEKRVVPNPLVKMQRDAERQLDKELSAIGFDPTARSRLGLAEVKRQSKLEELLAKRQKRGT